MFLYMKVQNTAKEVLYKKYKFISIEINLSHWYFYIYTFKNITRIVFNVVKNIMV